MFGGLVNSQKNGKKPMLFLFIKKNKSLKTTEYFLTKKIEKPI